MAPRVVTLAHPVWRRRRQPRTRARGRKRRPCAGQGGAGKRDLRRLWPVRWPESIPGRAEQAGLGGPCHEDGPGDDCPGD